MKKRRPRRISVLFIPDDNAEPYSFRLNIRLVRFMILIGIILLFHIIGGGYAYWRWYKIHGKNQKLIAKNQGLLEDNKRIYLLQQRFDAVNQVYQKVLSSLGVDPDRIKNPTLASKEDLSIDHGLAGRRYLAQDVEHAVQPDIQKLTARSSFVSRKNTSLHDYTPNLPTMLPVEGYLSADFSLNSWLLGGAKPGVGKWHPGIDIAGRRGTDILAAGAGEVVFAGWTSRYGNMLILHHGNNLFSYYAHNSKLLVKDRSFVRKGDPIAQLGNSGSTSKGPHLHFEIWKDGKPVNPRKYILAFHSDGS